MPTACPGFPPELRDRYDPGHLLGAGAMGEVFRARDLAGDRTVAVKILKPEFAAEGAERFQREARALTRVASPHVIELLDYGVAGETPYLVSEYLDGGSAIGIFPEERAVEIMRQVAIGLEAVHAAGLVHRDVKPANVLLRSDGHAVLADLGLALDATLARITQAGSTVGTPRFLAPETLRGETPTAASDWFSWGATLFQMVEGRPAFAWKAVLASLPTMRLPEPRFSKIDPTSPLGAMLRRVLVADPAARAIGWEAITGAAPSRPRSSSGESAALPRRGLPGAVSVPAPRRFPPWGFALVLASLVALAAWAAR